MKLSNLVVLATAMTSAARRGTPIHVVFKGTLAYNPSFEKDPNSRNATFQEKPGKFLTEMCRNELGGGTVNGELHFDNNFEMRCDCAHGNTKLPIEIQQDGWSAEGTSTGKC